VVFEELKAFAISLRIWICSSVLGGHMRVKGDCWSTGYLRAPKGDCFSLLQAQEIC